MNLHNAIRYINNIGGSSNDLSDGQKRAALALEAVSVTEPLATVWKQTDPEIKEILFEHLSIMLE